MRGSLNSRISAYLRLAEMCSDKESAEKRRYMEKVEELLIEIEEAESNKPNRNGNYNELDCNFDICKRIDDAIFDFVNSRRCKISRRSRVIGRFLFEAYQRYCTDLHIEDLCDMTLSEFVQVLKEPRFRNLGIQHLSNPFWVNGNPGRGFQGIELQ